MRQRKGSFGVAWLMLFLGYWAWRFAGIVGILVLVAGWVALAVWAARRP